MIRSVDFWPRRQAEGHLFGPRHAVVSISDFRQPPAVLRGTEDVFRLAFFDLLKPADDTRFGEETLFSEKQARALMGFVQRIHEDTAPRDVIVHCEGGVSRSAAVALFVQAATRCSFPTRSEASFANKRVLRVLQEVTGLAVAVPAPVATESGIFLF